MKITHILLFTVLFTACNAGNEAQSDAETVETNTQTLTKEEALTSLARELDKNDLKIDLITNHTVLIGDINNDGLEDAVIEYFIDDPQVHLDLGRSAMYELWKTAILINTKDGLTVSGESNFTDLVELSVYSGVNDLKLDGNKLTLNHLRDRRFDDDADQYEPLSTELIPMEFFIENGKFVVGK